MRVKFARAAALLALCAALLVAGWMWLGPHNKNAAPDSYRFVARACWFEADWQASIRCGELHTPKAQGGFVLPVVIIANSLGQTQPDPVVYLTGGPGASVRLHSEGIKEWLAWMSYAALGRDLILMDPRGTGFSRPQLQCEAFNRFNQRLLQLHFSLADELEQQYRIGENCFAALASAAEPIKPEWLSTQQSAADVRGLMAQLHYEAWNILGVSYGTRLALEVAHQEQQQPQPHRLRAMVLDSLYPAGYGGVQTWPPVLDDAFAQFFQGCSAQPECSAPLAQTALTPAQLREQFMAALALLAARPQTLSVRRWDGEAPITFVVNGHRFLSASFAAIYQAEAWPTITRALAAVARLHAAAGAVQALSVAAAENNLKALVEPYLNNSLSGDFNSLAFMAVDCADNPLGSEPDYAALIARYPLFAAYTQDQWRYQACHFLTPATAQSSRSGVLQLHEPRVPTLMLSGALDPITPLSWAGDLQQMWPQLQWHVEPQAAHSVLSGEPCLLVALKDFFDNPEQPFAGCEQR